MPVHTNDLAIINFTGELKMYSDIKILGSVKENANIKNYPAERFSKELCGYFGKPAFKL